MSYTAALPRAVLGGVHGRNEAHLQLSTDENWQGSGCCLYLPCVNMCLVAGQAGGPMSILQTRLCSPQIGEHGSLHPGLCPLPAATPCSLSLRPWVRWRPASAPKRNTGLWVCAAHLVTVTDGDSKGQCQAGGRMFGGECY